SVHADVTILNSGSADYHGRQLVRVIRNECWQD
ncbi:MAG: phosphonate metabolism protein/1,5-bisphosphokinase (PRPP-forming) PhnN, partial [Bradyrhizobium sp.]|nr:phosphonate metabolism protein/1,5-bisphosphokinase (PRPP-forming) PhnN [Bradyrhizobium sp.]